MDNNTGLGVDVPAVYKLEQLQYSKLLGAVLGTLDMSLPNKQQHAAATHAIRKAFDATYFHMLELTYPDASFGSESGSYSVEPTV